MRSRAVGGPPVQVSLFPFLAVLICTMGVLLLLLVVAVHFADQQTLSAQADYERTAAEFVELQGEIELTELRTAAVLNSRTQLQRELDQLRARRGHSERELAVLQSRYEQLQQQFRDLANPGNLDREQLQADTAQIQAQIAEAQARLDAVREQSAARPKLYSIVPYRSVHGTNRRPIYLECLEDKIVFRPGEISVSLDELEPPIVPGNPLDAALHAARNYYLRFPDQDEEGTAYPLLIVRPGGSRAYALARRAMQSWDEEFGYELVEDALQLDFGPEDPALAAHLRQSLATARAQYALLRQTALAQQRQVDALREEPAPAGLRASPYGGFIASGRQPAGNRRSGVGFAGEGEEGLSSRPGQGGPDGLAETAGTGSDDVDQVPHTGEREQAPTLAEMTQAASDRRAEKDVKSPIAPGPATSGDAAPNADSQGTASMVGAGGSPREPALAEARGQNWALPSYQPNATAYRRRVQIECRADGLTLDMSATGKGRLEIPYQQNLTTTADQLVDGVWTLIKSWGIAERNGYWLPELRFVVHPDGRAQFLRLRELLAGSGLDLMEVAQ